MLVGCQATLNDVEVMITLPDHPNANLSLEYVKTLKIKCDGTYLTSDVDIVSLSFYQNDELAISIRKLNGHTSNVLDYNVTYGTWHQSFVQEATIPQVYLNKTSILLEGRYYCKVEASQAWFGGEKKSDNVIDLRFGG